MKEITEEHLLLSIKLIEDNISYHAEKLAKCQKALDGEKKELKRLRNPGITVALEEIGYITVRGLRYKINDYHFSGALDMEPPFSRVLVINVVP
jgi:hypothetical protein